MRDILEKQRALIAQDPTPKRIMPFTEFSDVRELSDRALGEELLKEGAAGCLIVAGGQGTRLGSQGPKGLFPISPVQNKTLFQLFAERAKAASDFAGKPLPLAVMTSPENHAETVAYFKKENYFGLSEFQIDFFQQGTLPFLSPEGDYLHNIEGEVLKGPDGNGYALHAFYEAGLWDKWQQAGVRFMQFILVDNPLAEPFDRDLIGFHAKTRADVIVKATLRRDSREKVGVLALVNGLPSVVEYTEIPSEAQTEEADGSLTYPLANLSLFSFSMDFIKTIAAEELPLHKAFKGAPGSPVPNAWKFEYFIFDVLRYANAVKVLVYPREHCFSPVKNKQGQDSPETARKALSERDKEMFAEISGNVPDFEPFELSAPFHYPSEDLLRVWRGKKAPSNYF